MAETLTPGISEWKIDDHKDGTATFSITLQGGFDAPLTDYLAINNESFKLEVIQTATSWANAYGTAVIGAGGDIYNHIHDNNQFRFYVGKTGSGNDGMHFEVNGWDYNNTRVENYTQAAAPATPSANAPLTLGFVFDYDASNGRSFTVYSADGSQATWTPKTDTNTVRTYNFENLTNVSTQAGVPSDVVTTIKLTKAYTAPPVPEPATGSLSLLALAGLCARRRRK